MKKKVLFTANLESFFTKFLIPQLDFFKSLGYEVHIATKLDGREIDFCDKKYDVDFARSFNIIQNIRSFKQVKDILKENDYDIISCHTPFAGAITRLAAKHSKLLNTTIVYMAHGFHFYKGGNKLKNALFYNAEKYLANYTDKLITINMEDYNIARNDFKTRVYYVHGVGLNTSKFDFKMSLKEKEQLRESLNIKKDDFVMVYIADINGNKRQEWMIDSLKMALYKNENFHLILAGNDNTNGKIKNIVEELKLSRQIHILGFRNDVPKLLKISDLCVNSSIREGLPANIMEALFVGLPIVATDCRGNRDLINKDNGFIVEPNDKEGFAKKIMEIYKMPKSKLQKLTKSSNDTIKDYLLDNALGEIIKVYMEE